MHSRILAASLSLALLLSACSTTPVGREAPVATNPSVPTAPAPQTPVQRAPAVLGLALGGGAARGFAHVGVIQVLEEAGLKPQLVVGTSAGSLVAAIYASGKTGVQLQQVAANMDEAAITDWTIPFLSRGMLRGEALARYVGTQTGGKNIEDLPLPLGIVATDLQSGEGILFRRGDIGTAVRASSAVPAVFTPVRINGRDYVDGGLVAPVPARYARQMGADVVLAVDISSAPEGNATGGMLQVLLQTFAIMGRSINNYALKDADLVLHPLLTGVKSADFKDRQHSIDAGRAAMQAALPQLRALLEKSGKEIH